MTFIRPNPHRLGSRSSARLQGICDQSSRATPSKQSPLLSSSHSGHPAHQARPEPAHFGLALSATPPVASKTKGALDLLLATLPYKGKLGVMSIRRIGPGRWPLDMYRPGRGKAGRIKKVFRTKKEAEAYESEVLRQHAEGREVDDRAARSTTVGELWSQFRAHIMEHGVRGGRKLKPKTLANYDFKYRTYIEDDWQYTPVSGVTRERCRTWLADMTSASGEPVSNNARNDGAAVFRNLLNFGLNQGLLSYNPMKDRSGSPLPTPAIESRRANVYLTV